MVPGVHSACAPSARANFPSETAAQDIISGVLSAVDAAASRLFSHYESVLSRYYFYGGWCEKPPLSRADYAAFTDWLSSAARIRELDGKTVKLFSLLGSNKCWALHDGVFQDIRHSVLRRFPDFDAGPDNEKFPILVQTLRLPDGTEFIASAHRYHRLLERLPQYGDKWLQIRTPSATFDVRPVSTSNLDLGENVRNSRSILQALVRLDRALRCGETKYSVTFCFDHTAA
ncbi:MAG: hypothetical protein K1X83_01090 [Oligoflexia bacterium]|nr:hypothetical protein [Oligoflexia bacterium]